MNNGLRTFLFVLTLTPGFAQWLPSGASSGNIYYSNGNVGIGTTQPGGTWGEKLHVYSPSANVGLRVDRGDGAKGSFLAYQTSVQLGSGSNHRMDFFTNGLTKMSILPNGLVGIGTFEPAASYGEKLHIYAPTANVGLKVDRGDGAKGSFLAYQTSVQLGSGSNHRLDLFTNSTTKMTILPNGFVGIGTLAPQSLLAVKGTITSQEVVVTLQGWPDYVFENEYYLRPLNEVESFIAVNKHLPEVPSAEEVEKGGVNLGEMDAILLKKIEELTLYMIELKKENETLKSEVSDLREKMVKVIESK